MPARAGLECSSLGNLATEICTSEGLPKSFVAHTLRLILSLKEPCVSASGTDVTWCFWMYVTGPMLHRRSRMDGSECCKTSKSTPP